VLRVLIAAWSLLLGLSYSCSAVDTMDAEFVLSVKSNDVPTVQRLLSARKQLSDHEVLLVWACVLWPHVSLTVPGICFGR